MPNSDPFTFNLPSVQGVQGGRQFYLTSVPFSALERIILIDDGKVLKRSQRELSKQRSRKIKNYLIENKSGFILPALTGIISHPSLKFEATGDSSVGQLVVPMSSEIKLFDGQHRAAGIIQAVMDEPDLRHHMIPMQLFTNMSLSERQQAFSDINSNAKAVSSSLNSAYSHRNKHDQMLIEAITNAPSLKGRVDMERNAVSSTSKDLFSLKAILEASKILLGLSQKDEVSPDGAKLAAHFWDLVSGPALWDKEGLSPRDGRASFITYHSAGINALALAGKHAIISGKLSEFSACLGSIDYHRDAERWRGKCVSDEGKIVKSVSSMKATAAHILSITGLSVPPELRLD